MVLDDPELRRDESQREWRRHWEGVRKTIHWASSSLVWVVGRQTRLRWRAPPYDTLGLHNGAGPRRGGARRARSGFGGGCCGFNQWPVIYDAALLARRNDRGTRGGGCGGGADAAVVEEAARRYGRCGWHAARRLQQQARGDTEAAMAAASAGATAADDAEVRRDSCPVSATTATLAAAAAAAVAAGAVGARWPDQRHPAPPGITNPGYIRLRRWQLL